MQAIYYLLVAAGAAVVAVVAYTRPDGGNRETVVEQSGASWVIRGRQKVRGAWGDWGFLNSLSSLEMAEAWAKKWRAGQVEQVMPLSESQLDGTGNKAGLKG